MKNDFKLMFQPESLVYEETSEDRRLQIQDRFVF